MSSTPEPWPSAELVERLVGDADFFYGFDEDSPHAGEPDLLAAARRFRDVLGRFATGVTVVTSMSEGQPVGMTCQSFSSVSLAPPLVLFCASRTSRAWPHIERAGHFCVNLLAADQEHLSQRMATRGAEKFKDVDWTLSPTGAPLLEGITGYVDCTLEAVHEAGDHHVVIGRVQHLGHTDRDDPLLYYRGHYRRLDP